MALFEVNWKPARWELRIFAAAQVAFFCLVAWSLYRHGLWWQVSVGIVAVSAVVGLAGLIFPRFIHYVYVGWMIAVFPIGWVVSHVLAGIVYYGVFTPVGLLMRLIGRDKMGKQFDREAKTYWVRRPPPSPASRYFRQY